MTLTDQCLHRLLHIPLGAGAMADRVAEAIATAYEALTSSFPTLWLQRLHNEIEALWGVSTMADQAKNQALADRCAMARVLIRRIMWQIGSERHAEM